MLPFWYRRLERTLNAAEPVARTHMHHDMIRVWYHSGIMRTYLLKKLKRYRYTHIITKEDAQCTGSIPITLEHTWNPFDLDQKNELSKYFNVSRSEIDKHCYIDKELLIQQLLIKIMAAGHIRPYVSDAAITNVLAQLPALGSICSDGMFNINALKRKSGRILMERYCPIEYTYYKCTEKTLHRAFTVPKVMFSCLYRMVHNTKLDINITTIHNVLYSYRWGPRWFNPVLYKTILKQFFTIDETRTIVDATPNMYEKAVASWLLGCNYSTICRKQPPDELVDRLGIKVVKPQLPYDILFLDNRFVTTNFDTIRKYRTESKNMVIFIPHYRIKDTLPVLKPSKVVKIRKFKGYRRPPDYLFIFKDLI